MSNIIKFPKPKSQQDIEAKILADAIDDLVLSSVEKVSWAMVAVILADRLGEVITCADSEGSTNKLELQNLCIGILERKLKRSR